MHRGARATARSCATSLIAAVGCGAAAPAGDSGDSGSGVTSDESTAGEVGASSSTNTSADASESGSVDTGADTNTSARDLGPGGLDGGPSPCDADGDGHLYWRCGGNDCDDDDATVYPGAPGDAWTIEFVDEPASYGNYADVAIDSTGTAHVSFLRTSDDPLLCSDLGYATNASGAWVVESLDTVGVNRFTAIAIDAGDAVHIAWQQDHPAYPELSNNLRYATNAGGSWTLATVDEPGDTGAWTDLALAPDGVPQIVYSDFTQGAIRHAEPAGNGWNTDTIAPATPYSPAIAIDLDGASHVSYVDTAAGEVRYATQQGGNWADELVYAGPGLGGATAIAVSGLGEVQIVYGIFGVGSALRRAIATGGTWEIETVAMDAYEGGKATVQLDAAGAAHIAYGAAKNNASVLRYVSESSGAWIGETVDLHWSTDTSIALANGRVHVAYADGDYRLRYASRPVPDGVDSDCDGVP